MSASDPTPAGSTVTDPISIGLGALIAVGGVARLATTRR